MKSIRITSGPNLKGWFFLIIVVILCVNYKSIIPLLVLIGYIGLSLLAYFTILPLLQKWDRYETEKFRREMKEEYDCTDAEVDEIISMWTSL